MPRKLHESSDGQSRSLHFFAKKGVYYDGIESSDGTEQIFNI